MPVLLSWVKGMWRFIMLSLCLCFFLEKKKYKVNMKVGTDLT